MTMIYIAVLNRGPVSHHGVTRFWPYDVRQNQEQSEWRSLPLTQPQPRVLTYSMGNTAVLH